MPLQNYYFPDLSGENVTYRVYDQLWTLLQTGQKIEFDVPVFKDGLTIVTVSNVPQPFVYGVDWVDNNDDIDFTSMSKLAAYDGTFEKTLLKSITILKTIPADQKPKVSLTYQRLYTIASRNVLNNETPVEFNPDVLAEMLERLANLESRLAPVYHPEPIVNSAPKLLKEDPNKEFPENEIIEYFTVDTISGKNFIKPTYGSFFKDSVTIEIPERGDQPLAFGEDFEIYGMDMARTASTPNQSGVYQFVVMVGPPFQGIVRVKTHAYGGTITRADVESMNNSLRSMYEFLSSRDFITTNTLHQQRVITSLINRMTTMEVQMRSLTSGSQTFQDQTTGRSSKIPLRANDTNYHWWNIARLYKVAGDTTTITKADRFKFRFKTVSTNIMADVTVTVNVDLPDQLNVEATAQSMDLNYTLFGDQIPNSPVIPKFRIVYNDQLTGFSGIYLQIGLSLPILQDVIVIEDMSGYESCWIMEGTSQDALLPKDTSFMLPDGNSLWDVLNSDSKQVSKTLPAHKPYRAWEGSVALADVVTNQAVSYTHILPQQFDIKDIKKVDLLISTPEGILPYSGDCFINDQGEMVSIVTIYHASIDPTVASLKVMFIPTQVGFNLTLENLDTTTATNVSVDTLLRYVLVSV